jgi:hypothetical protein
MVRTGVPPLLVLALVALVYFDALWGPPRADQLIYLYEAAQLPSLGDLVLSSPSWNRSVSVGDHALYRPILYLFLAAQYAVFGRNSYLWQGTSLVLHALQCVLLLRLLQYCSARTPVRNAVTVALFSVLQIAAESVIWHHVNGYLLFGVLATLSLQQLLIHVDRHDARHARLAFLFALAATFVYEAGLIYCVLVAGGLVFGIARGHATRPEDPASRRREAGRLALAFAGIIVLYLAASAGDFLARFSSPDRSDAHLPSAGDIPTGLSHAVSQSAFWLGGAILPTMYELVPSYRMLFVGFVAPTSVAGLTNLLGVAALVVGAGGLLAMRRAIPRGLAYGVALGLVYVLAYSTLVAFGRSVPRGLSYTLRANLHYAYLTVLAVIASVALASWLAGGRPPAAGTEAPGERSIWALVLVGGLSVLVVVNALGTGRLVRAYRHYFAAPRLELLHHAGAWHASARPGTYFTVSRDCPGNDVLTEAMPWFGLHSRHPGAVFRYLDALYPGTSFALNRERLPTGARVAELSCAQGVISASDILGTWKTGTRPGLIRRAQGNRFELGSERGEVSPLALHERTLTASRWNLAGLLSHDRRYIFWENGAVWRR